MLKELFAQNKDIVINSDIDGFLCGMILQHYYGCRVVGFSDSRDTIWLTSDVKDIDSPIYIDLYVNRPDVICIEQHIIAFNQRHHNQIMGYGTKFNPNLERKRTFSGDMIGDYYHKYPFGTVHYIMALMAKEGINVTLPDLNHNVSLVNKVTKQITATANAGLMILRADDALYSTLSPYRENALDWWKWLDPQNQYPAIKSLRQFINSCEISKAWEYKKQIGQFFLRLGCDGEDGAFKNVTDDSGNILTKVLHYRDTICKMMGMTLDLPKKYVIHKGKYDIMTLRPGMESRIMSSTKLYSYAFIFGPNSRKPNFSYTIEME